MTTDSLSAGAGHWSAVRLFVEKPYQTVTFSQPNFLYIDSEVYAVLYAAKHKSLCQFWPVNNEPPALLKTVIHHVVERTFGIVGNKSLVFVPKAINFKIRAFAVIRSAMQRTVHAVIFKLCRSCHFRCKDDVRAVLCEMLCHLHKPCIIVVSAVDKVAYLNSALTVRYHFSS